MYSRRLPERESERPNHCSKFHLRTTTVRQRKSEDDSGSSLSLLESVRDRNAATTHEFVANTLLLTLSSSDTISARQRRSWFWMKSGLLQSQRSVMITRKNKRQSQLSPATSRKVRKFSLLLKLLELNMVGR